MAESLERSRKKWLSEGIFEKYWTKPTKKKGMSAEEQANNPSKDTMTKLGPCTITIEPHVFDAVMYAVKDPTPRQLPPQTMYRPIIQYGPPQGIMSQSQPPLPTPSTQSQNMQPNATIPSKSSGAVARPANNPTLTAPQNVPPTQNGSFTPQPSPLQSIQVPQSTNATSKAPAPPAPAPAPARSGDPVIQMLAERAATDHSLKGLMRVVADGQASADQLKQFQAHIDELTKLLRAREAAAALPTPAPVQNIPPGAPNAARPPSTGPVPVTHPPQPAQMANGRTEHHAQPLPQAQALRSKGPLPASRPDISAVVFEFGGGSGDRYMFPKYSILEYLPGGQVIASFLIVRKGSAADSKKYDPALDYYQPITIRLYAHQGRQLDALAKVVAPPDEVRKYMDDIMDNMTRAEYVLLAMRLPRETDQPPEEEERVAQGFQNGNQVLWTTPANPAILKQKMVKKPPTEGEQYQSFIASVSNGS